MKNKITIRLLPTACQFNLAGGWLSQIKKMKHMEKKTRKQGILSCILFVGFIAVLTAPFFPWFNRLCDSVFQESAAQWVDKMGMVGIVGIGFHEKVINFWRSRTNRGRKPTIKCECLDFVGAVHSESVYPLMYCHIETDGKLDSNRLKEAISCTCQYVPEILYAYDFKRAHFVDRGFTVSDAVTIGGTPGVPQWELDKNTQLQIVANKEENKFVIGMSHILTDGAGFLQYLYLLSFFYNGRQPAYPIENCRAIAPMIKNIHVGRPTEQTRSGKRVTVLPLRADSGGNQFLCLKCQITHADFDQLSIKAKQCGVTLNDIFLTAYARVIARLQKIETVVIPCPADLRSFLPEPDQLRIANMTGVYRRMIIEIKPHHTFHDTLSLVHIEMALQKSRCRCFAGIPLLDHAFHRIPRPLLAYGIRCFYRLLPVSYTNFGTVDHDKLSFDGCSVKTCYMTGTYRMPPDFQLSISTFQHICTLNCALVGDDNDRKTGQDILEEVKKEMLAWMN